MDTRYNTEYLFIILQIFLLWISADYYLRLKD